MDAEELIKLILNKTKVANVISEALESDDNSQKQYKEQPILQTADKIKKYQLNEKYLEMRKIASSCVTDIYADNMAKIFYHQGKFMENYTDNYEFNGYFERYFPTYQAMNDHQLRGYFSWRTKIRKGEKASCPSAFVFVYIYEIINQIGVKNPLDGFEKLNSIFLLYKNEIPNLSSYMNIWLKDYIVYYNLDCKLYTQPSEKFNNTLLDFENQTKEEIFNEIVSISSYKVENSKCYKIYNKEFIDITYGVISCLIENQGKENFQRQFLGRFVKSKYTIFNSAVFYQKEDIGNYCFKFNEGLIYLVDNQNWTIKRFLFDNNKIKGIGDLLKTIDFIMREKYKIKSTLKVPEISNEIKNIILNEIDKIQNPKIEINIDITKLDDIRASAIKTQKKLIVDENEIDSFFNREKIQCDDNKAVLNNTDKKQECSNECILSDIEKQFLNLILTNTSLNDFLKENRLMESVLVDQINEKLFDIIYDTAIDFAENKPIIIEDYITKIKEII